jgi:NCS1 family nucleobase:cation symporter-1
MLIYVQEAQYTAMCRAGTFFAAISLLSSQIYINVVQNTVGFGIDFASLAPK